MQTRRICVFCGSHAGDQPAYADMARALADELAQRQIGLVFGGGRVGLMGIIADSLLASGGEVIGVIPHGLLAREVGHEELSELRVVSSMHQRKAEMAELSDGFIALPGGLGTLEELFEVLTWHQLGIHRKPCGLLNVAGYWDPLLAQLDHGVTAGFIRRANRDLLLVDDTPGQLLDRMEEFRSPITAPWLRPEQI